MQKTLDELMKMGLAVVDGTGRYRFSPRVTVKYGPANATGRSDPITYTVK